MFLFEKKIVYLSLFGDGVKLASAGFVRISRDRDACRLDIHIKGAEGLADGEAALFLVLKNRELPWGSVALKGGSGGAGRSIPFSGGRARLGGKEFDGQELCGIVIRPGTDRWIAGYWQEPDRIRALEREAPCAQTRTGDTPAVSSVRRGQGEETRPACAVQAGTKETAAVFAAQAQEREPVVQSREREDESHRPGGYLPGPSANDIRKNPFGGAMGAKWEQLCRNYKGIHPFGDERMYLSIEPRDFGILQGPYQRLVNNSFLLHGFYNYRHLLLGPDEEIGTGGEICFYLGVPGTYFEREKMVAVMFGFEGFECSGPVENGKFGYYMRRVEI